MNHGKDCAHLYDEAGALRDCMKPCQPEATDAGDVEGCEDCGLSDCRTCGRTIRRCGIVGDGCEFCTPFDAEECECGNPAPTDPVATYGDPSHAPDCPDKCDGYACTYGCGTCFCPCHD